MREYNGRDLLLEQTKRTLWRRMNDKSYQPMKIKELGMLLELPLSEREVLENALNALLAEGKIERTTKGKYKKTGTTHIDGRFQGNAQGYGFVSAGDGMPDVFIAPENTMGAVHSDLVRAVLIKSGERPEGKITHILERGIQELTGRYRKSRTFGYVIPDNHRISVDYLIEPENSMGARDNDLVRIRVLEYRTDGRGAEGEVIKVIGSLYEPGTDMLTVMARYDLPEDFPERVIREADHLNPGLSKEDLDGRMDLRDWDMVTIDGEDARDLDDAVSLTWSEDGHFQLGVHIADVSRYVREDSLLDAEARRRGTSVYLPDRVIPMLPGVLSNGLCSLEAGKDRLAFSCLLEYDAAGELLNHQIAETVIHVKRRMSYTEVQKILTEDPASLSEQIPQIPMLLQMHKLSRILHEKRRKRGAPEFDFPEGKAILDEKGNAVAIEVREKNEATSLIEEFMLAANEAIAEDAFWQNLPFLYRVHEAPEPGLTRELAGAIFHARQDMERQTADEQAADRHADGRQVADRQAADRQAAEGQVTGGKNSDYSGQYYRHGGANTVHPRDVSKLLDEAAGLPSRRLIMQMALHCMKQARYSSEAEEHFGLALKHYCHFTSPIRRYPDLQIHRILKDLLAGRMDEDRDRHYSERLPEIAFSCSESERTAVSAEREALRMKMAQVMESRIGTCMDGMITGVKSYGIYVELENTVEGLVHITRIGTDHYVYDEESGTITGETDGSRYQIGDPVRVRIIGADHFAGTVDMQIINEHEVEKWEQGQN